MLRPKEFASFEAPRLIKPMTIATDDADPDGRFEIWRDRYRTLNEVIVSPERRAAFCARAEDWPLGDMLLSRASAPARRLIRTSRACAADGFDHWVLRVSCTSPMLCRCGESAIRVEPGRLFVGSFRSPSTVDYGDGSWVALIIPRHVASRWGVDLEAMQHWAARSSGATLLADFLLSLAEHVPTTTVDDVPRLSEAIRSVLVACTPSITEARGLSPEDLSLRQRSVIERIIRREIGSARLNVSRLAELSGISRSTLYRLFEGEGGLAAHIRQLRLDEVRMALEDPTNERLAIRELAERWGFHCTASFNRAFRNSFGVTPGSVRASGASARARQGSDFEAWLRSA